MGGAGGLARLPAEAAKLIARHRLHLPEPLVRLVQPVLARARRKGRSGRPPARDGRGLGWNGVSGGAVGAGV